MNKNKIIKIAYAFEGARLDLVMDCNNLKIITLSHPENTRKLDNKYMILELPNGKRTLVKENFNEDTELVQPSELLEIYDSGTVDLNLRLGEAMEKFGLDFLLESKVDIGVAETIYELKEYKLSDFGALGSVVRSYSIKKGMHQIDEVEEVDKVCDAIRNNVNTLFTFRIDSISIKHATGRMSLILKAGNAKEDIKVSNIFEERAKCESMLVKYLSPLGLSKIESWVNPGKSYAIYLELDYLDRPIANSSNEVAVRNSICIRSKDIINSDYVVIPADRKVSGTIEEDESLIMSYEAVALPKVK